MWPETVDTILRTKLRIEVISGWQTQNNTLKSSWRTRCQLYASGKWLTSACGRHRNVSGIFERTDLWRRQTYTCTHRCAGFHATEKQFSWNRPIKCLDVYGDTLFQARTRFLGIVMKNGNPPFSPNRSLGVQTTSHLRLRAGCFWIMPVQQSVIKCITTTMDVLYLRHVSTHRQPVWSSTC